MRPAHFRSWAQVNDVKAPRLPFTLPPPRGYPRRVAGTTGQPPRSRAKEEPTARSSAAVYVRAFAAPFLAALAFLSLESAADLFQPTVMAWIVDRGIAQRDLGLVLRLGALMLGVTGLGALGSVGRNLIASRVSWDFASRLRSDLFRATLSMGFRDLGSFDEVSLVTRQTNDVTQVQAFVNGMMRVFAKAPIIGVGSVAMAALLEPRLAPVFLVVVPLASLVIWINLKTGFGRYRRVQEALDRVSSRVREFLSGVRLVKAWGREDREETRFAEANGELASATTRALRAMALLNPAAALAVNLGLVAILWLGGYEVGKGAIPLGHVIAFATYLSRFLFAVTMITGVFTFFVRARVSWSRISEVLEAPRSEARVLGAGPGPREGSRGGAPEIRLEALSFYWSSSSARPVLDSLDFVFRPGEMTAIVGPTGSGKTSLLELLPRFREPSSGRILLDGRPLGDYGLGELRSRMALVPQRSLLFAGTIADNIRHGRPGASEAEVEEAARLAGAHEFVAALPEGYRASLGQGGVNLSGGQRQRLALARALVRRPSLLLLDDTTSAVDAVTEAALLAALRALRGRTSVLFVTQRVAAARQADRILVLEGGRISASGAPGELAREEGVYRDMIRAQLGKEALDVLF